MTKENCIPRTALVACSRFVDFAGAEIASLEIAQALHDLGVEVELAALEIGAPFEDEIRASGIKCIDLLTTKLSGREFDLLWVSHYVVAYHLLIKEELRIKTGIYSSLSHFEPLETPPLSNLIFSQYIVNSEENFGNFASCYPDFSERLNIFPNSAPAIFLNAYRKSVDGEIKSIAVISNHPPSELIDLIALLRSDGVEVDLIGIQGRKLRVSPDVLSRYSAVITIGKTVQYCLVTGTPVFCYDHFGGPGWINLESFDAAAKKNFSGRCSPTRRTSERILSELSAGFNCALNQRETLRNLAIVRFDLSKNLVNVLGAASKLDLLVDLSATDRKVLSRESSLFSNLRHVIKNNHQTIAERDEQITIRNQELASARQAIAERDGQITILNQKLASAKHSFQTIIDSNSWKITHPLRTTKARVSLVLNYVQIMIHKSNLLLNRSISVFKTEGIWPLGRKTISYCTRMLLRKVVNFKFKHVVAVKSANQILQVSPLVSFVIPVYDRTDLLRIAIHSALAQTMQDIEVILVMDGSPNKTKAVVDEFSSDPRVRIFSYPTSSGNAVRGRNKGILEARGKYIAFLDSDDIAAPDRLKVCLPLLESGVADVVYGAWRALLDGSRKIDELINGQVVYSPDCDLNLLQKVCVPCQSTVTVRRSLLMRAGFLKPRMKYREDHELWVRLAYYGACFKSVPHVLADLRLHAGNNELNFKGNDAHWETLLNEEYKLLGPRPKKIAFLMAGLGISGGAYVVLKHITMLLEQGHDAFVINVGDTTDLCWFGNPDIRIYPIADIAQIGLAEIDLLIATFWTTTEWLKLIPSRRKLYLVQSDERLFYDSEVLKLSVAETYQQNYEYITIAPWISKMFSSEFNKKTFYVPNGLDNQLFYPDIPFEDRTPQRLRVLIEGPISVPFKGMLDAYAAVEGLDCDIWIVSSHGKPESHWRYERLFEAVNQADMRRIYSSCDILLKMSRVESFSYPPLEAMACGCAVVLGEVKGGIEYAIDDYNVLMVPMGDVVAARTAVMSLLNDAVLRSNLISNGFATSQLWSWDHSLQAMLKVVEDCDICSADISSQPN